MSREVQWTHRALRAVSRLDRPTRERIARGIESFAALGQGDVKRLKGKLDGLFRLRSATGGSSSPRRTIGFSSARCGHAVTPIEGGVAAARRAAAPADAGELSARPGDTRCAMKTRTKDFDALKMMRQARDRISREIRGSFEEQAAYFKWRAAETRKKLEPPPLVPA